MVKLILYFLGVFISFDVCSQNNTQNIGKISSTTSNNPWDLNKYVWSHANANNRKDSKPPLNYEALDKWASLSEYLTVCNNGNYFAYIVQTGSNYSKRFDSVIVQSTDNNWRIAFSYFLPGFFSSDSKRYVFQSRSGLCFLHNGTNDVDIIKDVLSYKTPPKNSKFWMAYLLNSNTLVLRNLSNDTEKRVENVAAYDFDESGQWLWVTLKKNKKEFILYNSNFDMILQYNGVGNFLFHEAGGSMLLHTTAMENDKIINSLHFVNLMNRHSNTIWSSLDSNISISDMSLDKSGSRVIFTVAVGANAGGKSIDLSIENSIWCWQEGMGKASMKIKDEMPGIPSNMHIVGGLSFVENNNNCFQFTLQYKSELYSRNKGYGVQIDVWNYKDSILQSDQLGQLKTPKLINFKAICNVEIGSVIQLEIGGCRLKCISGDFAVVAKSGESLQHDGTPGNRFWEKGYNIDSNWLVCLRDNYRQQLPTTKSTDLFVFSPSGKFLIYNNSKQQCHYFAYELATGKLMNISKKIPRKLGYFNNVYTLPQDPNQCVGIAGWMENEIVLVYDNYDIWQLDIAGQKAPINLSNGYGRKNNIIFSLFNTSQPQLSYEPIPTIILDKDSTLLLRAFNTRSKYNGFYSKKINVVRDPKKLYMGPYLFSAPKCVDLDDKGMVPVKAIDNEIWIVKRQSATEAPNYFITKDFNNYKRLTNIETQINYNWLTTELHSFKQLDGSTGHGVLYKPENFDSTKKYPVIITFYFHLSDRLFQFPKPGYIIRPSIWEDPTWMVSHGYLVFVADIYFSTKELGWGHGVMNSLDGAAKYLSHMSYVDKGAIGAAGHSNSGRFGYYLFTHSQLFAAMAIGAGAGGINPISNALVNETEGDWLKWGELEVRLGNLWKNKAAWLDHTAVLQVDKSKSPLLLFFNNKELGNGQYPFQLYISLQRLDKKIWWLQYDNGGHLLSASQDKKDFTLRYTQFFDHYLKGAPAPEWMTNGVPARLKGIESGYALDYKGSCGRNCVICKKIMQSQKGSSN